MNGEITFFDSNYINFTNEIHNQRGNFKIFEFKVYENGSV